ncbi:hypothetical protein PG984_007643, partial [Apiospora sp. TS-2023a]
MDMDLSQIPALEPPPGSAIVPNFVDPVSIAPICLVVIVVTLPLMVNLSCSQGLRPPMGSTRPHTCFGRHLRSWLGCMAVKSTLLLFYLRIFSPQPNAKRLIWSGLIFIVVFYLISFIVTLASCLPRPEDGGWSSLNPTRGERCWEEDSRFAEIQGILGALTDLYVWIVPMTMVAKVRLSRKQKFGVYGVFLTGFLTTTELGLTSHRACIVSIINAAFRFEMFQSSDALWIEVPIYALGRVKAQASEMGAEPTPRFPAPGICHLP